METANALTVIPNNIPAVVVYGTPVENGPGGYDWNAYQVAAWTADGLALLVVPGHARLVPASDPDKFRGECWGVRLLPSWGYDIDDLEMTPPTGNGPFF